MDYLRAVRRLLLLVSAVVFVDTMLYVALVPLLPGYAEDYGLSRGGVGLLVATYAAGVLLAALPAGLSTIRLGPKRTVLGGLGLMSVASVGFGLADDVWLLGLARFAQGVGSSLSWAGALAWLIGATPRERRGEVLGTAVGAAVFGALLGPVVGAGAELTGPAAAFIGVGALGAVLFVVLTRFPPTAAEPYAAGSLTFALGQRRLLGGLWFMLLPALLFGVQAVLVPLRLGDAGWGAAAIGGVFLVAAGLEALLSPAASPTGAARVCR